MLTITLLTCIYFLIKLEPFLRQMLKKFYLVFLLACCWGPSFLFIKIAIQAIPPCTLATFRVGTAALLLLVLLRLRRIPLKPWLHCTGHFFVVGALSSVIPFALLGYGQRLISSGLAGLINGSIPVFTVLIAHFTTRDEKLSLSTALGIFLGLLGLAIVFFPSLKDTYSSSIGILSVVAVCICYAIAMVYARKNLSHLPPLVGPTCQLASATPIGVLLLLFFDPPILWEAVTWHVIAACCGLVLLGTFFAFIIYFTLLRIAGASYLSFSTFLLPPIAVVLGSVFFQEELAWNAYLGGACILLGLGITTGLIRLRPKRKLLEPPHG